MSVTLYRCRTPSNYLCPCGKVARKLGSAGVSYETVRVPFKKSERPNIEQLTGQKLVPVLVDGEEVIHDSKRIVEYIEKRYQGF